MRSDMIQEEVSLAEHLLNPELEEPANEATLARAKELSRKLQDWTSTGPSYQYPGKLFGSEFLLNSQRTNSETLYAKPLPCPSCLEAFDLERRLPRVLVQCGHTLCTSCLEPTYRNGCIRCPICFKVLGGDISWVSKLPVHSQIYSTLYVQKCSQLAKEAEHLKNKPQYQSNTAMTSQAHALQQQQTAGLAKVTNVVRFC